MDRLFAPWRIDWVRRREPASEGCVFCEMWEADDDGDSLVVARSERTFVVMNHSPYNPGHAMVVPAAHEARYEKLSHDDVVDHARVKQLTFEAMERAFEPDGYNTGLNLGSGAGGSIDDHLHTHVVPRWQDDTNFLPATADVKVIVQEIDESYDELRRGFESLEDVEAGGDGAVRLR
ncbi:MAG: HIT family protein [Halobacteriales archaeon]